MGQRPRARSRKPRLTDSGALPAALTAGKLNSTAQEDGFPPDPPRQLEPTNADIGSLFPDVERLLRNDEYPCSFLTDRFRSVKQYRKAARDTVTDALSYKPASVPLAAEVVNRWDLGEFVREKVVFSTAPGVRIPAYVHIPKGLKGPLPAIVDLHSHGDMMLFGKEKVIDFGRNHNAMVEYHKVNYGGRPTSTALVRRGYVVITTDALMFGERRLMLDTELKSGWDRSRYSLEDVQRLNRAFNSNESNLAKALNLAGTTWQGIVLWDDMRTIDYLATRKEVDAHRIGCVGVSFGGYRSLFLAGMDDRVAAACVVGFMSTVKPMARRHIDTHSWVHFVPGVHRYLDWPDIVAARAPKPLLVLQCRRDELFPLAGMQEAVDKIAAIYTKARARDQFTGRFYDVPHQFNVEMQEDAFSWFDEVLKR